MPGIEIRIPYVSYKTRTKGFPYKISVQPTEMSVQKNLQYYSNKVKLQTNLQPLNTTENDIEWSIVEGDNYCSINASTGELTIDSSAITQMVKVRAKSVSNPLLIEEREIVLTHREPISVAEETQFDIRIIGLQSSYNFVNDSTDYQFIAALNPYLDGYNVVFDIVDDAGCFYVTNINWDNNRTTVNFRFNDPPSDNYNILLKFYVDKMPELTKDVQINVKIVDMDIIFDNIPEAPYIPYEQYSFDFYTDPVVNFRNLDVSVISGREYLDVYYTTDVVGTSGTFNFRRNSREIEDYEYITVKFSDPSDNTIHEEVLLLFENITGHSIDVSGNVSTYEYHQDSVQYESFTWAETPNYNRELQVIVTQNPANTIEYYTSDVSGGSGRFNFRAKSLEDGQVNVRIQDPLTEFGKTVTFDIKNEKVARYAYAEVGEPWDGLRNFMTVNNVISYGNNLQPSQSINKWNVYDTSDNDFWNETQYQKEPESHYTSVNLYDTSLYMDIDYIPGNTYLYTPHYNHSDFGEAGGWQDRANPRLWFRPYVQYRNDSTKNLTYTTTVDISTNLPAGTYRVFPLYNNSEICFNFLGQENYMVLDSSHFGTPQAEYSNIIKNPSILHTDIPRIKIIPPEGGVYYSYIDPSANFKVPNPSDPSIYYQSIFDDFVGKEISMTYVETIYDVYNRPVDTDEYFYVIAAVHEDPNPYLNRMDFYKFYAPTVIQFLKKYYGTLIHTIGYILYNDSWEDGGIKTELYGHFNIKQPMIAYKMRVYPNLEYGQPIGVWYPVSTGHFPGFTSGLASRIPAGTYDIEINYKADIVPIDYTINVKVNVQ